MKRAWIVAVTWIVAVKSWALIVAVKWIEEECAGEDIGKESAVGEEVWKRDVEIHAPVPDLHANYM